MLKWFADRLARTGEDVRKDERGFTLIELLVVVIIIGILAAIAIPTFLGQRDNARNAQAVSNLRSGVTAMESYGASTSPSYDFSNADAAALEDIEPSLDWDGAGTAPNNVGITAANAATSGQSRGTYTLRITSQSGAIYTASANGQGEVSYTEDPDGSGTEPAAPFNP